MKKQQGFTLIEVMIVIVIVGVLASVAIPAYRDYVVRSRAGEVVNLLSVFKTDVQEHWDTEGDAVLAGLLANQTIINDYQKLQDSQYTTAGAIANNVTAVAGNGLAGIQVAQALENVGAGLDGQTISMTFVPTDSVMIIKCYTDADADDYGKVPSHCRNVYSAGDATTRVVAVAGDD